MSRSRVHYESELGALEKFHVRRLNGCPEEEVENIRSHLAAIRAAMGLPESQLPLLSFLSASVPGPAFRSLAGRLEKAHFPVLPSAIP